MELNLASIPWKKCIRRLIFLLRSLWGERSFKQGISMESAWSGFQQMQNHDAHEGEWYNGFRDQEGQTKN